MAPSWAVWGPSWDVMEGTGKDGTSWRACRRCKRPPRRTVMPGRRPKRDPRGLEDGPGALGQGSKGLPMAQNIPKRPVRITSRSQHRFMHFMETYTFSIVPVCVLDVWEGLKTRPKTAQETPMMAPRYPNRRPKMLQEATRGRQGTPKRHLETQIHKRPREAPRGFQSVLRGPKRPPTGSEP